MAAPHAPILTLAELKEPSQFIPTPSEAIVLSLMAEGDYEIFGDPAQLPALSVLKFSPISAGTDPAPTISGDSVIRLLREGLVERSVAQKFDEIRGFGISLKGRAMILNYIAAGK